MLDYPVQMYIFAFLILAFVVYFIHQFLLQAIRLQKIYNGVLVKLGSLKKQSKSSGVFTNEDYLALKAIFQFDTLFARLWEEYDESLHKQKEIDPSNGSERVAKIRATVSSSAYFSYEVLVESPLKTEFFKHLPGILTGIGIIGTFFGMLTTFEH